MAEKYREARIRSSGLFSFHAVLMPNSVLVHKTATRVRAWGSATDSAFLTGVAAATTSQTLSLRRSRGRTRHRQLCLQVPDVIGGDAAKFDVTDERLGTLIAPAVGPVRSGRQMVQNNNNAPRPLTSGSTPTTIIETTPPSADHQSP